MRPILLAIALLSTVLAGCADVAPDAHDHGDGHADAHGAAHGDDATDAAATHEAGHDRAAGSDEAAPHHNMHAGDHGQTGMDRPAFPPATGKVPTAEKAAELPQVSKLRFIHDVDLESSGYAPGNGTLADPYVIEGLYILGDLMLQDTDACVVIKNNWIGGQLSLNWNAQCVHVHHNHIYDLRVNENIRRDGFATGGLMERNEIEYIGQLRHYDGEFCYNTVGPMPEGGPFDDVRETTPVLDASVLIANIDGFNEALIHNNTFHGSVDLDFHGHHHGTGFFATHSHYHGDEEERKMPHDHTQRWTSVAFRDNTIYDEWGYGLRYEDRNHAGDDRLANSEQEETLELDHFHRTDVVIAGNTVDGAGIWVDVFNADDSHHDERNDGWLWLLDNNVILRERDSGLLGTSTPKYQPGLGYRIDTGKEVNMTIRGNAASYVPLQQGSTLPIGGSMETVAYKVNVLKDAHFLFHHNAADGFEVGIQASRFTDVWFEMMGNDFGNAERPTDFDNSVKTR